MTVASITDGSGEPRQAFSQATYLDFNATAPVDERVAAEVLRFMTLEFGNAGSRTHGYGQAAKDRVNQARREIAEVVAARPEEIIFTSGATESDNIAILGLAAHGEATGRKHIISTQIEHKAVLEPLEILGRRGFDVELLPPNDGGWVPAEAVAAALRPDTLLVSVMAANNETGVIQPVEEIAEALADHAAFLHVDAAQAFGKVVAPLQNSRLDLVAVSGHKIGAPKGIGALVTRRRGFKRPPLAPLMFGGGQERGLRPGTLPVPLIAGLGTASTLALKEVGARAERANEIKELLLRSLLPLGAMLNGDPGRTLPTTLNLSLPGVDSEAAIVALKDLAAVSNGSACTSQSYDPSHVLVAAGLPRERIEGAIRLSWGPTTTDVPADEIAVRLSALVSR